MTDALDNHVKAYQGNNLYDFDNQILLNWYPKRIVKLEGKGRRLLELGLGHGFSSNVFSEHFERHVIVEGSGAVIERFKKEKPSFKGQIIQTYFETFESSETFDVIVLGFVLEHVDDPVAVLKRFRRFLSPTGNMYVAVPNAEVLNRRLGHLAGLLPNILTLSDNDALLGHKRYYTKQSLSDDIQAAGYAIERLEGIYLKPLTTLQLRSLNLDEKVLDALCEVGIDYPELCCGMLADLKVR